MKTSSDTDSTEDVIELQTTMRIQNKKDAVSVNLWIVAAMRFTHHQGTQGDGKITFYLETVGDTVVISSTFQAYELLCEQHRHITQAKVKRIFGV